MKLLIIRPAVLAGEGGVRSFAPGLVLDVDAATTRQLIAQQVGVAVEQDGHADSQPQANATPRRRNPPDAAP